MELGTVTTGVGDGVATEGVQPRPGPWAADGATSGPVLVLSRVSKRFGATRALQDVSVSFAAGEIHAVVGENGAGKTTLLNVIGGLVRPDPPSAMEVAGTAVDFSRYSPKAARALGIAIVPQEPTVVGPMTVAENIFLGREPHWGPVLRRRDLRKRAAELLRHLGATLSPDEPVENLSVAQLQLVEIAKALSHRSRVVAMDEPSAVLGGEELERLFDVIHRLAGQGVAIIYVSHRLDEVFAHCDRFTVLKDGRVAGTGLVREVTRSELVRMMVGREVSETFPPRAGEPGPVRLRVEGLSVPGKLDEVSLEVRAGEILGIAGLMGSGRTTLAKALFGAIAATGVVEVDGHRGPFGSPREALKAGLAYLPEDRQREGLAVRLSVRWNLSLLSLRKLARRLVPLVPPRAERELVRRLVDQLAIRTAPTGDDLAARLSGGNQQKVVLAKWLEAGPRVLILDEPTRGIDVGTKEEIYRLLRRLAQEGLALMVISSELIEILGLADRILVLADGRVRGELQGGRATEEDVMRLATGVEEEAQRPEAVRSWPR
jgi:rhamnose transport system ATP-binding protein